MTIPTYGVANATTKDPRTDVGASRGGTTFRCLPHARGDGWVDLICHELAHEFGGHIDRGYIGALSRFASVLFKLDRRAMLADINYRA